MGDLSAGISQSSNINSSLVGLNVPLEVLSISTFARLDTGTHDGGIKEFIIDVEVALLTAVGVTSGVVQEGSEGDAFAGLLTAVFDAASLGIGVKLGDVEEFAQIIQWSLN